jgi:hypothetical protein
LRDALRLDLKVDRRRVVRHGRAFIADVIEISGGASALVPQPAMSFRFCRYSSRLISPRA